MIEGNQEDYEKDVDMSHVLHMVEEAMETGLSKSDAVKEVANRTGIKKNVLYDLVHRKAQCS